MKRVLVAGIGNIFMGDDGFGCEVARQLARGDPPAGVDVVDFGIRGMDLGHALAEGYELAILIDTVDRGGAPGTLYVIEPEIDVAQADQSLIAPHGMDPVAVLRCAAALGERKPRVLLVACQPGYLGGEHGHLGLSTAVADAVGKAVAEVRDILDDALRSVADDRVANDRVANDRVANGRGNEACRQDSGMIRGAKQLREA